MKNQFSIHDQANKKVSVAIEQYYITRFHVKVRPNFFKLFVTKTIDRDSYYLNNRIAKYSKQQSLRQNCLNAVESS